MSERTQKAFVEWRKKTNQFLGLCLQPSEGQMKPTLRTEDRDGQFVEVFLGGSHDKRQLEPMPSTFSDAVAFTYWAVFRLDRPGLTVHESSFALCERIDSTDNFRPRLRVDYEREKEAYHQSHVHLDDQDFHIPIGHTFFRPTFEDVVLAAIAESERAGEIDRPLAAAAIRSSAAKRLESWQKVQTRRAVRARPKVAIDELLLNGKLLLPTSLDQAGLQRLAAKFAQEAAAGKVSRTTREKVLEVLSGLNRVADFAADDLR